MVDAIWHHVREIARVATLRVTRRVRRDSAFRLLFADDKTKVLPVVTYKVPKVNTRSITMSVYTKNEQSAVSTTDTIPFMLPKSDMADLRRSSRSLEPMDDEVLLEDYSDDVETLLLLLEEFQTNGPQRIETISRRVNAGNPYAIAMAARDLKSTADALSATTLRNLAGALEQSTGLVTRGCQERLVARLRREMDRCLDHIPAVIASVQTETWTI